MQKDIRIMIADPAGNITAFVLDHFDRSEYAAVANRIFAMEELGAEQVAFVTGPDSMEMCGLEFCGNASRAFAYMIAKELRQKGHSGDDLMRIPVHVSGAEGVVEVEVKPDTGFARVEMPLHRSAKRCTYAMAGYGDVSGTLVDLGGIVHFVIEDAEPDDELFSMIKDAIAEELDPPAIGVMFMKGDHMYPVVYVKDVDTVYHEGSCATGTTAAVIARAQGGPDGEHQYRMIQPAGELMASAETSGGEVRSVRIAGEIKLHEPQTITVEL